MTQCLPDGRSRRHSYGDASYATLPTMLHRRNGLFRNKTESPRLAGEGAIARVGREWGDPDVCAFKLSGESAHLMRCVVARSVKRGRAMFSHVRLGKGDRFALACDTRERHAASAQAKSQVKRLITCDADALRPERPCPASLLHRGWESDQQRSRLAHCQQPESPSQTPCTPRCSAR